MEIDIAEVQNQLKTLPSAIRRAFYSPEVAEKIHEIGERHDLMLDKVEDLIEETGMTMIGLKPSKLFADTIATRLEIKRDVADKIAEEISREVLGDIRKRAQEDEDKKLQSIRDDDQAANSAAIEQAGGFTLEDKVAESHSLTGNGHSSIETPDHILAGIENPASGSEKISRKEAYPQAPHVEALVDHLLNGSVAQPQQKIISAPAPVATPAPAPVQPPAAPKKTGPDPYRETFGDK